MSSRFNLEKILSALVLLTVVAILAERRILEVRMVIEPGAGYGVSSYADPVSGGNSEARIISKDNFEWRCTLRDQHPYPFCGFEVIFDPARQNGLDLQPYDRIRIWLNYEGPAETVRVYLRNFDPAYSTPGQNDTTKYNQIEFGTGLLNKPVEFEMGDFFVANWWFQRYRISPQLNHPQFDNIVVLEVQTGNDPPAGDYHFQLERVEFSGQIISTQRWYQAIIAIWLVSALLFLAMRIVRLNRELKRRKARELELMEINGLLDTRSRQLEEMARTDPLTGVFNRQGIEEAIKVGLKEWRLHRKPLSIIMLDVDFFKEINDTHGHSVGDRVLAGLSELMQKNIRQDELLARWGGEEFVLVCPNAPLKQAGKLAEKLRSLVEGHRFENNIKVTVSVGVATLTDGETLDQLFVRADKALYQAKHAGRNQIVLSTREENFPFASTG